MTADKIFLKSIHQSNNFEVLYMYDKFNNQLATVKIRNSQVKIYIPNDFGKLISDTITTRDLHYDWNAKVVVADYYSLKKSKNIKDIGNKIKARIQSLKNQRYHFIYREDDKDG